MARVCIVRQSYVPLDPRVWRQATALASAGHAVDVLCLRRKGERAVETRDGITVRRFRVPPGHDTFGYLLEYALFFLRAALRLTLAHLRRRFDVIQVNTLPDPLVFAAVVPRILGTPVLLDLHECAPEFYATKFGRDADDRMVRAIARLEQGSIRFAAAATTCTHQMRDRFVSRGAARDRITVILNGADEEVFRPADARPPLDDAFRVISHGSIEKRYGLDTLVHAAALLRERIPNLRVDIVGEGSYVDALRAEVRRLRLDDVVRITGEYVPIAELVAMLDRADVGVVAVMQDEFRDLVLCHKMYDFIAMRTPAAVSRTRAVCEYFDEECFAYFDAGDASGLADALVAIYRSPDRGRALASHAARAAESHRWINQTRRYLEVVEQLVARG